MSGKQTHHTIDYVEFTGPGVAAQKAFYASVFGWSMTDYGPEYASFDDGRTDGGFEEAPTPQPPLVIVYSQDLNATEQTVIANGGVVSRPTFAFPGGWRFHFTDPAGHELAVWTDNDPTGA